MPSPRPARCRAAPSGSASRRPTANGCTASISRRPRAPQATRDADPRLRRQCLERPGRRRPICTSSIPRRDVVAFHYRGYRPSTGTPVGRGADGRRAAGLRFRGRAGAARARRSRSASASAAASPPASPASGRLDGLILVTPFDSLKAVAAGHVPVAAGRRAVPPRDRRRGGAQGAARCRPRSSPPSATRSSRRAAPRRLRAQVGNLVFDRTIARRRPQRHLPALRIPAGDARGAGRGRQAPVG